MKKTTNEEIADAVAETCFNSAACFSYNSLAMVLVVEKAVLPKGVTQYTKEEMSMFINDFLDSKKTSIRKINT